MKMNETLLAVAGIAIGGYIIYKKKRNSESSTPGIGTTKNQKFYDAVKERNLQS